MIKFDGSLAFKPEMMIANLNGWKSQTRRLPKFQPIDGQVACDDVVPGGILVDRARNKVEFQQEARFKPGDVLACREAFRLPEFLDSFSPAECAEAVYTEKLPIFYHADKSFHPDAIIYDFGRYRPAMYMPYAFCRAYVIIKNVKFERVQAIGADDVLLEGFRQLSKDGTLFKFGIADRDGLPGDDDFGWHWVDWNVDAVKAYRLLWDSMTRRGNNTQAASGVEWPCNPWVTVYDYEFVLI